jgi:preprotein translocase subunit SecD
LKRKKIKIGCSSATFTFNLRNSVSANAMAACLSLSLRKTTLTALQQQGDNRIVVQLPGVQDTTRAKEILGRYSLFCFYCLSLNARLECFS